MIKSESLVMTGMVWPVSSDNWKGPLDTYTKNKRKAAGGRSEWAPLFIQIGYFRTILMIENRRLIWVYTLDCKLHSCSSLLLRIRMCRGREKPLTGGLKATVQYVISRGF